MTGCTECTQRREATQRDAAEPLSTMTEKRSLSFGAEEQSAKRNMQKTSDFEGDTMAKILVGPTKTLFSIHFRTFVAQSPVFERMMNTGMREATEGVVELPDTSPKTFNMFMNFAYASHYDVEEQEYCEEGATRNAAVHCATEGALPGCLTQHLQVIEFARKYMVDDLAQTALVHFERVAENLTRGVQLGNDYQEHHVVAEIASLFSHWQDHPPDTDSSEFKAIVPLVYHYRPTLWPREEFKDQSYMTLLLDCLVSSFPRPFEIVCQKSGEKLDLDYHQTMRCDTCNMDVARSRCCTWIDKSKFRSRDAGFEGWLNAEV